MNGQSRECLNLGSYNYLGFADDWQETCKEAVMPVLDTLPVNCASSRVDLGTTVLHKELEALVARFVGKEDAIVYNMGYGTNSTTIPALVRAGLYTLAWTTVEHLSPFRGSSSRFWLVCVRAP
jgi:serine palmitoyltransferase